MQKQSCRLRKPRLRRAFGRRFERGYVRLRAYIWRLARGRADVGVRAHIYAVCRFSVPSITKVIVPLQKRNLLSMTTEELNSYRLTSMEEPTDEMLEAIMKEACEEAMRKRRTSMKAYFAQLNKLVIERRKAWQKRLNGTLHHE